MKTAKELGYKVGDVFVYDINSDRLNNVFNSDFSLQGELTLVQDDGSSCPLFRQGDIEAYEDLDLLRKIKDASAESDKPQEGQHEVTPKVTTCQHTAIQEILLACFSDEISVEISMDAVTVNWQGLSFVVDEYVSLEQIVEAVDLLSQQQVEV